MTVVGRLHSRSVSNSAEFKSFLLSTCIEALESTLNFLSSSLILVGAGRHKSNDGGKKVAMLCSRFQRILYTCLARSHASLRVHLFLPLRLLLGAILEFGSEETSFLKMRGNNYSSDGPFFSRILITIQRLKNTAVRDRIWTIVCLSSAWISMNVATKNSFFGDSDTRSVQSRRI